MIGLIWVQALGGKFPAPWKLEEEAGSAVLTLTREVGGTKAVVAINVDEQVRSFASHS